MKRFYNFVINLINNPKIKVCERAILNYLNYVLKRGCSITRILCSDAFKTLKTWKNAHKNHAEVVRFKLSYEPLVCERKIRQNIYEIQTKKLLKQALAYYTILWYFKGVT
jgi:hypothetical protein